MSELEELSREELIDLVLQLRGANAALEEQVRRLERLVSRNSGNSSMPPSSDDLPGRRKPAPKRAQHSERARGKQRGAKGSAMPWVCTPSETVFACHRAWLLEQFSHGGGTSPGGGQGWWPGAAPAMRAEVPLWGRGETIE